MSTCHSCGGVGAVLADYQSTGNSTIRISLCDVCEKTASINGYIPIKAELVDHPQHYNSHPSGVECINIVRHHSFNIGSAIKYLWRAGLKQGEPSTQDLEKAVWYIKDEIELIKRGK